MKLLDLVNSYEAVEGPEKLAKFVYQGSGGQLRFLNREGVELTRSDPLPMATDWNGARLVYQINAITGRYSWCLQNVEDLHVVEVDDELINDAGEICIVLPRNHVYNRTQKTLFICESSWISKQLADGVWKRTIG